MIMQNGKAEHGTIEQQLEHLSEESTQYLTFMLNAEAYAINLLNIREIIDFGHITKVPMMSKVIMGVINLRGSIVPVIDLAARFDQHQDTRSKRSSILILEMQDHHQNYEIGVTVDEVNEVIEISAESIEATPSFGTNIRTDFIKGMGKVRNQLLLLLDIENILDIEELSVIQ